MPAADDETHLGPLVRTVGRDESPASRWGRSALLGGLGALFLAPGLGFPILSRGPYLLLFFGATLALAVVLTGLAWATRRNVAVHVRAGGVVLVDGQTRSAVPTSAVRRAGYHPDRRRFELESVGGPAIVLFLPPRLGRAAVEAVGAALVPGLPEPGAGPKLGR